jgi:FtsH-binding integral membrane protein
VAGAAVIDRMMRAQSADEHTLEFLRLFFLLLVLVGFAFYGVEHWVVEHYRKSWQSRIPFFVSALGFPLAMLMFFDVRAAVRRLFVAWMFVSFATGIAGTILHMIWNAADAEVALLSTKGIIAAVKGGRPVLAALAHTHIGAIGLLVGLTLRNTGPTAPKS